MSMGGGMDVGRDMSMWVWVEVEVAYTYDVGPTRTGVCLYITQVMKPRYIYKSIVHVPAVSKKE